MNTALKLPTIFTYADYCRWPNDERWELIDGEAYAMAAPSRLHQKMVGEVYRQISNYLQGKSCEAYVAPFDVRLKRNENAMDEQINTVVQPDIAVICDLMKLDDKGCQGAPDWIIEILSPTTALIDMKQKRAIYEKYGVREYWIVHPVERWGVSYRLNAEGIYGITQVFALTDAMQSAIFPDLFINWDFLGQLPVELTKYLTSLPQL